MYDNFVSDEIFLITARCEGDNREKETHQAIKESSTVCPRTRQRMHYHASAVVIPPSPMNASTERYPDNEISVG